VIWCASWWNGFAAGELGFPADKKHTASLLCACGRVNCEPLQNKHSKSETTKTIKFNTFTARKFVAAALLNLALILNVMQIKRRDAATYALVNTHTAADCNLIYINYSTAGELSLRKYATIVRHP